jgi:hypothetical protein
MSLGASHVGGLVIVTVCEYMITGLSDHTALKEALPPK